MEKEIAAAKAAASSIVSQDEKKSADKQSKPPEEPTIENLQGNAKWRQLTPELRKKIIDLHHVTKELWIAFGGSLIFGSVFGATTYAIATSIAVVAAFFPPLLLIGLAGIFLGAIATFAFFKLSAMAINNNKMQTMNAVYKELDIRPIENPYSTNSAGLVATSTFVGATSAAAQPIIPPPLFFIGAIAAAVAFVANFLTAGYLKKRAKQRVELVSEVKEKLKNSADSLTHPIHNSAVDVSSSLTPTEEENNQLIAIYTKTKNHVEGIKKPPGPDNTLRDTSMLGIH
jgi:hypothetical protein